MITYLHYRRRRHPPASLSVSPCLHVAIRLIVLIAMAPMALVALLLVSDGKAALKADLTRTAFEQWLTPKGIAMIALVGLIILGGVGVKTQWRGSALTEWRNLRRRRLFAPIPYFGRGVPRWPRLED